MVANAQAAWEQTRTDAEIKLASDAGGALSDVSTWASTASASALAWQGTMTLDLAFPRW